MRACEECGVEFLPRVVSEHAVNRQRYCTPRCTSAAERSRRRLLPAETSISDEVLSLVDEIRASVVVAQRQVDASRTLRLGPVAHQPRERADAWAGYVSPAGSEA